jgi:preprotein translocase subunit SecG
MSAISYLLMVLLILTAIFLIILVLIQRGKGGGLAGALGGMGGQSAFGTKAGDLFTKITIGAAAFWILLCILSVRYMADKSHGPLGDKANPPASAPDSPDKTPPAPSENDSVPSTPAPTK